VDRASQRAERRWEIESYVVEASLDRRHVARKAAAMFGAAALVMLLVAFSLTSPIRTLGCCAVALGLVVGGAIVLHAAPPPRRVHRPRRPAVALVAPRRER
jgi:hypothetical protein